MSGVERIAAERQWQIDAEGWTPYHDDHHDTGELTRAAMHYARIASKQERQIGPLAPDEMAVRKSWPWDADWWKPSDDPIRNLVKAGALIAAEIDRLERAS